MTGDDNSDRPKGAVPEERPEAVETINLALLRGARFHQREAVFTSWGTDRRGAERWLLTPDWRADRNTIRVALVLRQRLQVEEGQRVALWAPFSEEWAVIERAAWSIGAVSVPVGHDWDLERVSRVLQDSTPEILFADDWQSVKQLRTIGGLPESVMAVILMRGEPDDEQEALPFPKFMEYGGVLDTAERASMWRTTARRAAPRDVVAWEYQWEGGALVRSRQTQATVLAAVRDLQERFPPVVGRLQLLVTEEADPRVRIAAYSGWSDGSTVTVFARDEAEAERGGRMNPQLIMGDTSRVNAALSALSRGGDDQGETRNSFWGDRAPSALPEEWTEGPAIVVTDTIAEGGEAETLFRQPTDLEVELVGREEV